jgi:hypothetical protein
VLAGLEDELIRLTGKPLQVSVHEPCEQRHGAKDLGRLPPSPASLLLGSRRPESGSPRTEQSIRCRLTHESELTPRGHRFVVVRNASR